MAFKPHEIAHLNSAGRPRQRRSGARLQRRFTQVRRCTARAATAPASLIARCARTGANRLPERSANQPNAQGAGQGGDHDGPDDRLALVARVRGCATARNTAACSSRPPLRPTARAATACTAPRKTASSAQTVPAGISSASHRAGRSGRSRSTIALRTRGTAVAAATPAATTRRSGAADSQPGPQHGRSQPERRPRRRGQHGAENRPSGGVTTKPDARHWNSGPPAAINSFSARRTRSVSSTVHPAGAATATQPSSCPSP